MTLVIVKMNGMANGGTILMQTVDFARSFSIMDVEEMTIDSIHCINVEKFVEKEKTLRLVSSKRLKLSYYLVLLLLD